ncbi:MAG: hypothetical protein K2J72_01455, partial [Oscillospiraceae bacterium]|nr:hypothetical protein [Oscillospiraceae bacterium]
QGGAVVFAPPRNAVAFLTSCSVSDERDFALCGARPKAPPLDFASWAQLDQLMSTASPPKVCYMVCELKNVKN